MKTYSVSVNGYEFKTDDTEFVAMLMVTDAQVSVMLLRHWPEHGVVHLGNETYIAVPAPAVPLEN